ncbi:MAG: hypothetical protein ACE5E5_16010, partial [Phycisphaerae bacterium]
MSELQEHRRGEKWAYDDRILGGGRFVTSVLERAGEQEAGHRLAPEKRDAAYWKLVERVCSKLDVEREELLSGGRRRPVVKARQVVAYLAVRKLG